MEVSFIPLYLYPIKLKIDFPMTTDSSKNTSYIFRKAVKADCVQLLDLIKELAVYEKAPEEVIVTIEEMEESGFGKNPVWEAFVVEDAHSNLVGMSLFYIRYSTWKGRRLYLEDLIVTEQLRGQGLGEKLLDMTIAYGKEKGYYGVCWQVLDWNEPAIRFYEKYNARFDKGWWNVSVVEGEE